MKKHYQAVFEWLMFTITKKWPILILAAIVAGGVWKVTTDNNHFQSTNKWLLDNWWGQVLDPVIGLWTFFIALFIWVDISRKEYLDNLPNRLSVLFVYEDKPLFYCHKATLPHEGDIRNLGLSIAQTANDGRVAFTPFFKIDEKFEYDSGEKKNIKHFILEMYLTVEPIKIMAKMKEKSPTTEPDTLILLSEEDGRNAKEYCLCQLEDPEFRKAFPSGMIDEILKNIKTHSH